MLASHCVPSTPRRPKIQSLASPESGTVRLDFLHSFGTWLVPHMLRGYRVEHPGVRFELHQDSAQFLVDRIAAGTSDLAVVSPQPRDPQVAWMQIAQQSLALAVPADHRFAKLHSVELADAADEPFIGMHPNFGMRRILDELCAAAGFTPNFVFESSELATVGGTGLRVLRCLGHAGFRIHRSGPKESSTYRSKEHSEK